MVRVSGAGLETALASVVQPMSPHGWRPGRSQRVLVRASGQVIDDGVAVLRRGPATATGEDLCEIVVHGNPVIVQQLLDALVDAGVRMAMPGEFTRRALLNGKLDLIGAESVDLVIRATTPGGVALGRAGLSGAVAARVQPIRDTLVDAVAELEARLDYPDDELALVDDGTVVSTLKSVARQCRSLAATQQAGRALVDGVRVALVGAVNAGKSSLFNRLLGRNRSLVHAQPGTTRDVVEATCTIGPLAVTLLDTAGERTASDPVEAAGIALARTLVDGAQLLLVVLGSRPEGRSPEEQEILERTRDQARLVVLNGVDLYREPPAAGVLQTSAATGEGIERLESAIVDAMGVADVPDLLVATSRQRDALLRVASATEEALQALPIAGVAVAADSITEGLSALDDLTGADTREDVLDAVFARFCIGK